VERRDVRLAVLQGAAFARVKLDEEGQRRASLDPDHARRDPEAEDEPRLLQGEENVSKRSAPDNTLCLLT
jgi:hypothetical protein